MTVKTILTEPNKLLRQISLPVEKVGKEEQKLMDDMLETMYAANGIGLAAIQIGIPKRIIVMDISKDENKKDSIKYNKDILHQSKLLNYFNGDYTVSKIEKDLDNFLKKIKKNKKYFFSKKDKIFIESLKSDGVNISKKFEDLYTTNDSEIPTDIQVMANNGEKGLALLRIVEVIGQDKLERMDEDTLYFIISILNQLNIDLIRNKILLKVLPLKV